MADFDKFYKKLSVAEGGYVNDPDDAGGETYRGISRRANPGWIGWKTIDQIKKEHPNDYKSRLNSDNNAVLDKMAKTFYKDAYWDIFDCDDYNSQRVATQIADTAVNCGQSAAIKIAQRVLGLRETGKWTLDLLNQLVAIKD